MEGWRAVSEPLFGLTARSPVWLFLDGVVSELLLQTVYHLWLLVKKKRQKDTVFAVNKMSLIGIRREYDGKTDPYCLPSLVCFQSRI